MSKVRAGQIRVGTSGWVYPHWKGRFYPQAVKGQDRFAYYAARFDTVEINGSFYRLPSEAVVESWAKQAPAGFVFAWKASRFITQAKKLKDVGDPVALVFARMAPLGEALGPALFQLPPQLRLNLDRLAGFLELLPSTLRSAVEFRHSSWYTPAVLRLLTDHDVALCISDHHDAPAPWEVTASFAYVRGHGPGGHYVGRYSAPELDRWAETIAAWTVERRDVYAFFDNDIEGAAPVDALALKERLQGAPPPSDKRRRAELTRKPQISRSLRQTGSAVGSKFQIAQRQNRIGPTSMCRWPAWALLKSGDSTVWKGPHAWPAAILRNRPLGLASAQSRPIVMS
jgi:uncharacterized protein YecE (DUF72 family)